MATVTRVNINQLSTAHKDVVRTFCATSEALKEQGKALFRNTNFVAAIQTYQKGFVLCNEYFEILGKDLPMKCDFSGAEEENKEDHRMWLQDFELLKAQFCNNMATCY